MTLKMNKTHKDSCTNFRKIRSPSLDNIPKIRVFFRKFGGCKSKGGAFPNVHWTILSYFDL